MPEQTDAEWLRDRANLHYEINTYDGISSGLLRDVTETRDRLLAIAYRLEQGAAEPMWPHLPGCTVAAVPGCAPGCPALAARLAAPPVEPLRELLAECLGDMDEGDDLTTLTPQQACNNMGYCPDLGYPVATDGCLPCRVRAALAPKEAPDA